MYIAQLWKIIRSSLITLLVLVMTLLDLFGASSVSIFSFKVLLNYVLIMELPVAVTRALVRHLYAYLSFVYHLSPTLTTRQANSITCTEDFFVRSYMR